MSAADDYRAGYEAGYFYGRMAELNGEPYDNRSPWDKEREKAELNDEEAVD